MLFIVHCQAKHYQNNNIQLHSSDIVKSDMAFLLPRQKIREKDSSFPKSAKRKMHDTPSAPWLDHSLTGPHIGTSSLHTHCRIDFLDRPQVQNKINMPRSSKNKPIGKQ